MFCSWPSKLVRMKRGLTPFAVCSALAMTVRGRSQLLAAYSKRTKCRCFSLVTSKAAAACCIGFSTKAGNRSFLAKPTT